MHLILTEGYLKTGNDWEVSGEVHLHHFAEQLLGFYLDADGLQSELVVRLVENLEFALVHHREVGPKLKYLCGFDDRVFAVVVTQAKVSPHMLRLGSYFQ